MSSSSSSLRYMLWWMMILALSSSSSFLLLCHGISFQPYRISYDTLTLKASSVYDNEDHFYQALTTHGIISITHIPPHAQDAYKTMIRTQDACIQSLPHPKNHHNNNNSDRHNTDETTPYYQPKQVQTLPDGTVRHTIATKTIPSSSSLLPNLSPLQFNTNQFDMEAEELHPCLEFDAAATIFRTTTQTAIMAFAQHLSQYLIMASSHKSDGIQNDDPTNDMNHDDRRQNVALLQVDVTKENEHENATKTATIETFHDVVQNGVHLEHFHSYVFPLMATSSDTTPKKPSTLQLHTDQGLFLAFTPGRYANTGELTNGFYITIPVDGEDQHEMITTEVQFTDDDALIFMLGDGVNQYINPKIVSPLQKLRAVPHSLQLDASVSNHDKNNRIWYGVMILPPSNAIHPMHTDMTFGELRHGLIRDYDAYVHLACSNAVHNEATARMLQDSSSDECNNVDEIYCWHRCMNVTEYDVSVDHCDETFRVLSCINPRDEQWSGILHGDYFPGCIDPDTVTNETEFPKLPDYPRVNENDVCSTNFQTTFNDGTYVNSINLENGDGAIFQYTVVEGATVMGRLIFNGIFGFLSIGFAGSGGAINFMSNARVMVATRGDEFSPRFGLDLSLPNAVHDYIIDPVETTFRIWGEQPYVSAAESTLDFNNNGRQLKEYSVLTDECYTILTFTTDTIADRSFNVQGSDTMIWAANNMDAYMQYHGSNRGMFTVDWTTVTTSSPTTDSSSAGVPEALRQYLFITMTIFLTTISIMSSLEETVAS